MNLNGKTALVTGASRGIGRATALALAAAGARVLVHYGRAAQEASTVAAAIRAAGGHAEALGADLADPAGPGSLAAQVSSLVGEHLDILVLNAGVSKAAPLAAYTTADVDALFATNVRGTLSAGAAARSAARRGLKHHRRHFRGGSHGDRQARAGKPLPFSLTPRPRARWRRW